MDDWIQKADRAKGIVYLPGDKSLAHRALIIAALAKGKSIVSNLPPSHDVVSTIRCLGQLGVNIKVNNAQAEVDSDGREGFKEPNEPLDCGYSGTTVRLLAGILASCPFQVTMVGDASLSRRPMERIAAPLRLMGATVECSKKGTLPLIIRGTKLKAIHYTSPIASAQIKSSILLAGLAAEGSTKVTEPMHSRDHTERMLSHLGIDISIDGLTVTLRPGIIHSFEIDLPGDPSLGAYLAAVAASLPDSILTLKKLLINPLRMGAFDAFTAMGASVKVSNPEQRMGESVGDVTINYKGLGDASLDSVWTVRCLDEIPALAVAALASDGQLTVNGIQELRIKESDRVEGIRRLSLALGGYFKSSEDWFIVSGPSSPPKSKQIIPVADDHRLVMAVAAAAAIFGNLIPDDPNAVAPGHPGFVKLMNSILERNNL